MFTTTRPHLRVERLGRRELLAADLGAAMELDAGQADEPVATADAEPMCYLKYKLERCFVKSWSTSGDADDRPMEEVSSAVGKSWSTSGDADDRPTDENSAAGKEWRDTKPMGWDNTTQKKWTDSGINFDVDAVDEALADERPTEEVAFYYNKIAFQYARTIDGKEFGEPLAGELLR